MGLWDALSGSVWHWNSTRTEVHRVVFPRLQGYQTDQILIRDVLFAHYVAFFECLGQLVFSEHPEIKSRKYAVRIKSVNKIGFMNLASSYVCDSTVRLFADSPDSVLQDLGAHVIFHACLLYNRDELYKSQRIQVYANRDRNLSARLLASEVALVLGLDATSERDMFPWFAIQEQIEAAAANCLRDPDWSRNVTHELSRPPRLGGYPDSLMN